MFLRIFFLCLLAILLNIDSTLAARVNIFLNISGKTTQTISFKLKELKLINENGQQVKFKINKKISSSKTFGQYFLATKEIPAGNYSEIRLILDNKKEQKKSINFAIRKNESLCLFLVWHLQTSAKQSDETPVISVETQNPPLGEDTIYISCEDIDTVFAVRTDLNQVQASVGVSGKPKDLVLLNQRLYILSSRDRSIYLVETSSFRTIDRFLLPLVISPSYLLVMPDNTALVTDPKGQYLIRLDLTSGELIGSKRLGHQPMELFFEPNENLVFVSSPLDQAVFFLDSRLSLIKRLSVPSPRGLVVLDNRLYVAEYTSGLVGIFSFPEGEKIYELRSGLGCIRLYPVGRRIFIANQKEGTISILRLGQRSISKKIRTGGAPFSLISCARRRWLYAANRKKRSLTVIDLTSEKMMGEVELGGIPFGLAGVENSEGESRCLPPNCPSFTSPF